MLDGLTENFMNIISGKYSMYGSKTTLIYNLEFDCKKILYEYFDQQTLDWNLPIEKQNIIVVVIHKLPEKFFLDNKEMEIYKSANAITIPLKGKAGKNLPDLYIVWINKKNIKEKGKDFIASAIHEFVHVGQYIIEYKGLPKWEGKTKKFNNELLAYITQRLLFDLLKSLEK